jgi:hypothetical protein
MRIEHFIKTRSIVAATLALALACPSPKLALAQAQSNPPPPSSPQDQPKMEGCNTAAAAVIGAVAGALLSRGNNRLKGAAIGGGLAAAICVAYNYKTRQTKTAQQVSTEYTQQHQGEVPTQSFVAQYETHVGPADQIRRGDSADLASTIDVIQGTDGIDPKVEEEITLLGPDGKPLRTTRKPANPSGGGGEYQTQFTFKLPDGAPQGAYAFKTALYLNGQQVKEGSANLQVASAQDRSTRSLLAAAY